MTILVTGSRAPAAILLARTLHAAGHRVYTADSLRPNFGQVSRAVVEDFRLPSPRFSPNDCLLRLAQLAHAYGIEAIVPTCEETFALAAGRARLPEMTRLLCPEIRVLDTLHHKGRGIAFAARLGIPTPESCSTPDFQRDGILKRAYSRFSHHVLPLRGTEAARRDAAARQPADSAEWLWQEWIDGTPLCTYSLCAEGRILSHAAYRTPYRVGLGAGLFYQAVDGTLYDTSLARAQTLAQATGYTGSLSLDFLEEPGGRLVLIEINPRATMGVALLTHRPEFAACWDPLLQTGIGPEGAPLAGTGRRQLTAAMVLLARGRRWRDLLTTPDVLADAADPGPGRAALRIYLAYVRQARAIGLSPTALTTHDIEWNGPS